jgi:hypothetical protein
MPINFPETPDLAFFGKIFSSIGRPRDSANHCAASSSAISRPRRTGEYLSTTPMWLEKK